MRSDAVMHRAAFASLISFGFELSAHAAARLR
jgi:hypothetical protein